MDDDFFNELMGNFNQREQSPEDDFHDMLIKFMHLQNHGSDPQSRQMEMLQSMDPQRRNAMTPSSTMNQMFNGDIHETSDARGNAHQQLINLLAQLRNR